MTTLLVDTSVLIKWFHERGESQVEEARAIRDANRGGGVDARMVDLALYEIGNVLLTRLRWRASDVAEQLEDLVAICGAPIVMEQEWLHEAAFLGATHHLTFYDAAWAASARGLGVTLVSADTKLLTAGLAESAAVVADRLRLK